MLEWKFDGWEERNEKLCHLHIGGDLKKEMKQEY